MIFLWNYLGCILKGSQEMLCNMSSVERCLLFDLGWSSRKVGEGLLGFVRAETNAMSMVGAMFLLKFEYVESGACGSSIDDLLE